MSCQKNKRYTGFRSGKVVLRSKRRSRALQIFCPIQNSLRSEEVMSVWKKLNDNSQIQKLKKFFKIYYLAFKKSLKILKKIIAKNHENSRNFLKISEKKKQTNGNSRKTQKPKYNSNFILRVPGSPTTTSCASLRPLPLACLTPQALTGAALSLSRTASVRWRLAWGKKIWENFQNFRKTKKNSKHEICNITALSFYESSPPHP